MVLFMGIWPNVLSLCMFGRWFCFSQHHGWGVHGSGTLFRFRRICACLAVVPCIPNSRIQEGKYPVSF